MKTFKIRVTQSLYGFYEGELEIEATSKAQALKEAKNMSEEDIDNQVNWSHMDEYWGDPSTIQIHRDSIETC